VKYIVNRLYNNCNINPNKMHIIAEKDNKWTRAIIYQIVEKGNNSRLPLIITTNMSINKIVERYDYRTYSRLKEMCFFIENTGRDIRELQG